MLTTGADILSTGRRHQFAVPAFNMSEFGMLNAVFATSTALRAPIMIAIHPLEIALVGEEFVTAVIAKAHKAPVPVAIHLDHGSTYDEVANAIRMGFTSVMIDASHEPFEENIRRTDDEGRPIALADDRADDLAARAARSRTDPLALVTGNPMFAGLDDRPAFTEPFARVLTSMHLLGVRAAVEAVLARLGPS